MNHPLENKSSRSPKNTEYRLHRTKLERFIALRRIAYRLYVPLLVALIGLLACEQKPAGAADQVTGAHAAAPGEKSAASPKNASGKDDKKGMDIVPVLTADVVRRDVPVLINVVGAVEAYATVQVKAQVSGLLQHVHFREGQDVKQGDPLFTIDSAPYVATLHQREADAAKSAVVAKNAEKDNKRYADLVAKKVVSQEETDQARTTAESTAAQARSDQAAVEYARLQVGYCAINAPITGRTGNLMVNEGNLVQVTDTVPLVVINQIQPVYVSFTAPERELPAIRRLQAESGPLKVKATIPGEEANPVEGDLTFIDNGVDSRTGTIRLKATFTNEDKRLWPGQFVNVSLTLTTEPNVVVAPSQAIQTGQKGTYVYIIQPGEGENAQALVAVIRLVKVGRTLDGQTVITQGLEAGEKIVTDGHLRLTPGAKVEIKTSLNGQTPAGGK